MSSRSRLRRRPLVWGTAGPGRRHRCRSRRSDMTPSCTVRRTRSARRRSCTRRMGRTCLSRRRALACRRGCTSRRHECLCSRCNAACPSRRRSRSRRMDSCRRDVVGHRRTRRSRRFLVKEECTSSLRRDRHHWQERPHRRSGRPAHWSFRCSPWRLRSRRPPRRAPSFACTSPHWTAEREATGIRHDPTADDHRTNRCSACGTRRCRSARTCASAYFPLLGRARCLCVHVRPDSDRRGDFDHSLSTESSTPAGERGGHVGPPAR